MKITLIRPGMGGIASKYRIDDGRMEPLQLAIIAGMIPRDDEVVMFDDRMEEIPFENETDLVGISVNSFSARRGYEIATEYRKRGVPVVLGGVHVTLLPEEAVQYGDSIVIGDAEPVWQSVVEDARKGELKRRYSGRFEEPQKGVIPDRSIFKGKGYMPISLVQFSRGCPFGCSFCSVSRFFGRSHNCRKVKDVLREIDEGGLRNILFVDDNMIIDRGALKGLLKEMDGRRLRWASQSSLNMVKDKELMKLMADTGCIGHLIGFESIDVNTLKWLNKDVNLRDFDLYRKEIKVLRDHGFQTWASFMIGSDHDDLKSIKKTVDFAISSKFSLSFFHILQPYPGTEIYNRMQKEGRLLYDGRWWNHPDFEYNMATFVPKKMTPLQLSDATVKANRDFYSISSISKRLFDPKTNIRNPFKAFVFLKLNHILRSTSI